MFTDTQVIVATTTLILLWLAYSLWQAALLNHFRQRVFALRDAMFIMAAKGELSFDDPAYGMLRMMQNGLIGIAPRFTFAHLMLATVFRPHLKRDSSAPMVLHEKLQSCLDSMKDRERAKRYADLNEAVKLQCARYIVCWTPVIGVLVAVIMVVTPVAMMSRMLRGCERIADAFVDSAVGLEERDKNMALAL